MELLAKVALRSAYHTKIPFVIMSSSLIAYYHGINAIDMSDDGSEDFPEEGTNLGTYEGDKNEAEER